MTGTGRARGRGANKDAAADSPVLKRRRGRPPGNGNKPAAAGCGRTDSEHEDLTADIERGVGIVEPCSVDVSSEEEEGLDEEQAEQDQGPRKRGLPSKESRISKLLSGLSGLADTDLRRMWQELPTRNANKKAALMAFHKGCMAEWRLRLIEQHSVLLYGLGSKRDLLDTFAQGWLTDGACVVFPGWSPQLNARAVLVGAASAVLGRAVRAGSSADLLQAVRDATAQCRLYLVIHNIDGPGLRSPSEQVALSQLASLPGVHLIASCDCPNTPLLWSMQTCGRFRWDYMHAPTYAASTAETQDISSLLLGARASSAPQRRAASTVLRSLPANARRVFALLLTSQLDDPEAGGLSLGQWFRMAHERFLVGHEDVLKSHLTELRDHELVKTRAGPDDMELLYVPLEEEALRELLEEINSYDA